MTPEGVKTVRSDKAVNERFVRKHLEIGIDSLIELRDSGNRSNICDSNLGTTGRTPPGESLVI